jgi:hypothetical protein
MEEPMKYFDVVELIVCDMNMSGWGVLDLETRSEGF